MLVDCELYVSPRPSLTISWVSAGAEAVNRCRDQLRIDLAVIVDDQVNVSSSDVR